MRKPLDPLQLQAEEAIADLLREGDGVLWAIDGNRLIYFAEDEIRVNLKSLPEGEAASLLHKVARMSAVLGNMLGKL